MTMFKTRGVNQAPPTQLSVCPEVTWLVLNVTSLKVLGLYLCKEADIGQLVRESNNKNDYRFHFMRMSHILDSQAVKSTNSA